MEDNLDVKSLPRTKDATAPTEECVIAMKVYGKCRQQDCLKPDFVAPEVGVESIPINASRSGEELNILQIGGTTLTTAIPTSGIISFNPNLVDSVQIVEGSFVISDIRISNIQAQNLFVSDGYWKVTIRYRFSYRLNLLDATGNILNVGLGSAATVTKTQNYICAYSEYEKQVVLFGGVGGKDVVLASNLFANNGPYSYQNAPYVLVEAKATPLAVNVGTVTNPCSAQACGNTIIGVTIGLFTIIKLFRLVNTTMLTNGPCDIPVCNPIIPGDPCSFFNEIPFPFEDFDPASK
ncbi:hypothetical protein ADU90_14725 [Clostridium botulinum]|uniref:Uncharacterized protein n=1 Tax=Clostridium botulinum C/D str. DC5 TaxID=1443128 RepID=A0A0A0IGG2_CLOBO|nr:hypothetical protein [Clostridium botulinum]KEI01334.1 hypothetical protein Z952_12410 [Clostridium botulinum C/D str. BKT75002]KEI12807.1 hypothetical protein Z954_04935 [Clostridium botulinum C/D str. BKT2873]KGM93555.1 hypothetical protein Z956_11255 [Clostridium botulinum D str. CCUG 7971]KGM98645.1 hypothetical protein Z955_10800 [Clostridium botulinum C/D str. DC5]KOC45731.1 hypothetical protein ADU88_13445 [Clostridium botulinum]